MGFLCEKSFGNHAMNPATMRHHLERIHSDKRNSDLVYFNMLWQKLSAQPNMNAFLSRLFALILED